MKNSKPTELGIFYYGASGGFYVLYLLLLSREIKCVFNGDTQDLNAVMQQHWNIKSVDTWKTSEVWPNNIETFLSDLPNKVYYFCNPSREEFENFPGIKLVLYTDIDTQCFMARSKRALWFIDKTLEDYQNLPLAAAYINIKDPAWPECKTLKDFENLPQQVKQECLDTFDFDKIVDTQKFWQYFKDSRSTMFNKQQVFVELVETIDIVQSDIAIKLQDVIRDSGRLLYEKLGLTHYSACDEFTNFYIDLHTAEQKSYLLK
jgi:hypothetical protein